MPADGDILVPIRTVSVIGTTDIRAADPDEIPVTQDEVDQMLDDGERLVPGFRQARALRVWAGVRPLFQDERAGEASRHARRQPHATRSSTTRRATASTRLPDDVRRQADDVPADGPGPRRRDVPAARRASGRARPPTSVPPGNEDGELLLRSARGCAAREATLHDEQLICECELIGRARLEETMRAPRHDQPRRHPAHPAARHGPVPGRLLHLPRDGDPARGRRGSTAREASESLRTFLQERWKGMWPILYGDQLRQARLDDWIFQGLLDVEHLPAAPPDGAPR